MDKRHCQQVFSNKHATINNEYLHRRMALDCYNTDYLDLNNTDRSQSRQNPFAGATRQNIDWSQSHNAFDQTGPLQHKYTQAESLR